MTRILALCLVVGTLSHATLAVEPGWRTVPSVTHAVTRAR